MIRLIALLLLPMSLFAASYTKDSTRGEVTVTVATSDTGITVADRYYQDMQKVPGTYTIDGKKGTAAYQHLKVGYGFRIDDPALARAIDGKTAKVVLTYESEPLGARDAYLVTVVLP
jgi:hypothetical protein